MPKRNAGRLKKRDRQSVRSKLWLNAFFVGQVGHLRSKKCKKIAEDKGFARFLTKSIIVRCTLWLQPKVAELKSKVGRLGSPATVN
jgi:hypothetical protein